MFTTNTPTTCQHTFMPGEVRCLTCPAHRVDCDCPTCEPVPSTPCPSWCTLAAGHPYDSTTHEGDNLVRVHEVDAGEVILSDGRRVSALVDSCETITPDGRVTITKPRAALFDTNALDDLTGDDLGKLADFLGVVSAKLASVPAVETVIYPTPDGPTTNVADAEAIRVEWPAGWTVEQQQAASDDMTARLDAMVAEVTAQR